MDRPLFIRGLVAGTMGATASISVMLTHELGIVGSYISFGIAAMLCGVCFMFAGMTAP